MIGGVVLKKVNVVLVVLNENFLDSAIQSLNFDNADVVAVMTKKANVNKPLKIAVATKKSSDNPLNVAEKKIPRVEFSAVSEILNRDKDCLWLICGYNSGIEDIYKAKDNLMANGVAEEKIVNFELSAQINLSWLANLRYIEKHGANFFVTGSSYTEVGIDFNCVPRRSKGVNLSNTGQNLRQSYLTAKYVFEHVKHGTIKFVLIGLMPFSSPSDDNRTFDVLTRDFQYDFAFGNAENAVSLRHKELLNDKLFDLLEETAQNTDFNFERAKDNFRRMFTEKAIMTSESANKLLTVNDLEKNLQFLEYYVKSALKTESSPLP